MFAVFALRFELDIGGFSKWVPVAGTILSLSSSSKCSVFFIAVEDAWLNGRANLPLIFDIHNVIVT